MAPLNPEKRPLLTPAATNLQDDAMVDQHAAPLAKKRVRLVSLDAVRGDTPCLCTCTLVNGCQEESLSVLKSLRLTDSHPWPWLSLLILYILIQ